MQMEMQKEKHTTGLKYTGGVGTKLVTNTRQQIMCDLKQN